ncbi:hypothetical protein SD457_03645 [Coprobacillaceae bacterium CR2/5/TPMF4]|nr:hypothetical protein SD457_03645 [Coprobacillaceae bacterium CR2/5/TPMF4]
MPDYYDQNSCFIENLVDAGCDHEMIEKCKLLKKAQQIDSLIYVLSKHRNKLIDKLHQYHRQIDSLDYLLCKLKKILNKITVLYQLNIVLMKIN